MLLTRKSRIDTDCALASVMDATPLLVLTGVASAQDALRSSGIPKMRVTSHLGALLDDDGAKGSRVVSKSIPT
jgi:ribonucleotide monophosphatase NagD (HAD superfamily)